MPPDAAGDRLSDLTDDILHHVLSFLPAEDAVQTCLLARRWRNLWKFATSLHIRLDLDDDSESMEAAREFVDHLLLLQRGAPIDTCELSLFAPEGADLDDDISRFKLWTWHILMCETRILTIDIRWLLTLISDHLEVLHLDNMFLEDELVKFSSCPALKELKICDGCHLGPANTIMSRSLKCLEIDCPYDDSSRTRIDTPNLHSLRLEVYEGSTPLLKRMPCLVEAFVNIEYTCDDYCSKSAGSGDCVDDHCSECYGVDGDTDNYVLLQGLSEAQKLVLRSSVKVFIFRRDLKWRPIFGNLRNLLLDEYWCVPDDFSALAYMLEHSLILEKLTIEFYFKKPGLKVKGRCNSTELSSTTSWNLKVVDVKCRVTDERVFNVLEVLGHSWHKF